MQGINKRNDERDTMKIKQLLAQIPILLLPFLFNTAFAQVLRYGDTIAIDLSSNPGMRLGDTGRKPSSYAGEYLVEAVFAPQGSPATSWRVEAAQEGLQNGDVVVSGAFMKLVNVETGRRLHRNEAFMPNAKVWQVTASGGNPNADDLFIFRSPTPDGKGALEIRSGINIFPVKCGPNVLIEMVINRDLHSHGYPDQMLAVTKGISGDQNEWLAYQTEPRNIGPDTTFRLVVLSAHSTSQAPVAQGGFGGGQGTEGWTPSVPQKLDARQVSVPAPTPPTPVPPAPATRSRRW